MTTKPFDEMTNDEFRTWAIDQMLQGWVPLKTYRQLFPNETQTAIDARLQKGQWVRGVHYSVPDGGTAWVNLVAIRQWIAAGRTK